MAPACASARCMSAQLRTVPLSLTSPFLTSTSMPREADIVVEAFAQLAGDVGIRMTVARGLAHFGRIIIRLDDFHVLPLRAKSHCFGKNSLSRQWVAAEARTGADDTCQIDD